MSRPEPLVAPRTEGRPARNPLGFRAWFTRRRTIWVAVLAACCIPVRVTTVPEWHLRYLDALGNPVVGLPVRETYRHYALEFSDHKGLELSDAEGHIVFPARTFWVPLGWRIGGPVLETLLAGVHASYGSGFVQEECRVTDAKSSESYGRRSRNGQEEVHRLRYENEKDGFHGSLWPVCAQIEARLREAAAAAAR